MVMFYANEHSAMSKGAEQGQEMVSSEGARRLMELLFNSIQEKARLQSRHDTEMLAAIDSIDRLRRNWLKSAEDARELTLSVQRLERTLTQREQELRTAQAELRDARNEAKSQLAENNDLKADLNDMNKRFRMMQQVIKQQFEHLSVESRKELEFIQEPAPAMRSQTMRRHKNTTNISDEQESDNLDYDETADSVNMEQEVGHLRNGRSYNRMSITAANKQRSSSMAPPKRNRSKITPGYAINEDEEMAEELPPAKRSKEHVEVRTTVTITDQQRPEHSGQTQYLFNSGSRVPVSPKQVQKRTLRKSFSENSLLKDLETPPVRQAYQSLSGSTASTLDIRCQLRTPGGKSWTNGRHIEQRRHKFEPLATLLKITNCDVCHGGINFAAKPAVKCVDCQQQVHKSCATRLALPCVPRSMTPRTPSRKRGEPVPCRLQDFCPATTPMIPYPIIHCVIALEKRGLAHEGIYRIPGKNSNVMSLLNELRTARAIPKLDLQDTEVITDVIKKFLRELRDPLIPKSSLKEFVQATKAPQPLLALNAAICDLPQPNRDTLAYLCLHWQKVAEQAHLNKMPVENIARVVAPSVLISTTPPQKVDMVVAGKEMRAHELVMIELLRLRPDYWERFLSFNAALPYGMNSSSLRSSAAGMTIGPTHDPSHAPAGNQSSPTAVYPPPLINPRRNYKLFDSPY